MHQPAWPGPNPAAFNLTTDHRLLATDYCPGRAPIP